MGKLTVIPVRASSLLEELSPGRLCLSLRRELVLRACTGTALLFCSDRSGKNDKLCPFLAESLTLGLDDEFCDF